MRTFTHSGISTITHLQMGCMITTKATETDRPHQIHRDLYVRRRRLSNIFRLNGDPTSMHSILIRISFQGLPARLTVHVYMAKPRLYG